MFRNITSYDTNTCGKDMKLIIRDVVSDEYKYNMPHVAYTIQRS